MHLALFPAHGKRRPARVTTGGPSASATPCVTITVDTGQPQSTSDPNAQQKLHHAVGRLHTLCGELGLPATWGVGEPFLSPLVRRLCVAPRGKWPHEIAMRLAPRWSTPLSRRMLLAEALARCARQADVAGLEVTTVFADDSLLAGNYDLVVKRGITSVRAITSGHRTGSRSQCVPRPLRYGLWEYPVACSLPADRSLMSRRMGGSRAVRRRRSGTSWHGVLHVAIDVSRLTAGDRWIWRTLDKSLRLLGRWRAEGGVRIEPLRTVTARLASVPAAAPQRSILRRAA